VVGHPARVQLVMVQDEVLLLVKEIEVEPELMVPPSQTSMIFYSL
jgi:hypothetical protein